MRTVIVLLISTIVISFKTTFNTSLQKNQIAAFNVESHHKENNYSKSLNAIAKYFLDN